MVTLWDLLINYHFAGQWSLHYAHHPLLGPSADATPKGRVLKLVFTGKYPQSFFDLMRAKLHALANWKSCNGLFLFSRRYKIPPKLKNQSSKYLGVVLERKLYWNLNIEERSKKVIIARFAFKKAKGLKLGLSHYIVSWIYTAIKLILL